MFICEFLSQSGTYHIRSGADNEDRIAIRSGGGLTTAVLCDGAGSFGAGACAAALISEMLASFLHTQFELLYGADGEESRMLLLERIERITPEVFAAVTGSDKVMCANVDFDSGLVYRMLNIPEELYTPLFAIARVTGWCAHRIEEVMTSSRIIRPAYKSLTRGRNYIPMESR